MKIKQYLHVFSIIVAILAISQHTRAQFTGAMGTTWNNPMSASISQMIVNKANEQTLADSFKKESNGNSNTPASTSTRTIQPAAVTAAQMDQAVRFRPTGTRLMIQSLSALLGGTPDQQAQTSKLLLAILDKFDQQASKGGYPNDLALALSSFIAMNSAVYHENTIASDEKIVQLRNLIAELVTQNHSFDGLTDRKKQETYEFLVLSGGLAFVSYQDAHNRGSVDEMKTSRQYAAQNIRSVLHIEPDSLNFTNESLAGAGYGNGASNTAQSPAAVTLDVKKFAEEFGGNVVRSNQLYTGKRVGLSGTVTSVETINGRVSLIFETGMLNKSVVCRFNQADVNQLAGIQSRQQVTVEGTVFGLDAQNITVVLDKCRVR